MATELNCFSEKDNRVYFTGKYMEVFIPDNYFNDNMAKIVEDRIETLGIFLFRVYKNEDKKEKAMMHVYKLPIIITTRPSNYQKEKLTINGEVMTFLKLEYYQNDIFIDSTLVVESSALANQYITYFHSGKVPNFISYDDVLKSILDTVLINKMGFPVPSTLLEIIVSEINRDSADISKSFRFQAAEGANKRNYKPVSIKQIPSFNSTFSSVTFEDIDYQLTSSVNKTKYNKKEVISPIEKTIKY